MKAIEVGTKVRFRGHTWLVASFNPHPEPSADEPADGPCLRLVDVDDQRHQVTILKRDWGRLRPVVPWPPGGRIK